VIIGHSGDTEDTDYLKRLLDRGSYIGMDRFGLTHLREQRFLTTEQRVRVVVGLCRDGFSRQILLSHDTNAYPDGRTVEFQERTWPDWRFSHIPEDVVPALLEAGVTPRQVEDMTRRNARDIFERQGAY
jgi:phosphotriesterase-related protein